MNEVTQVCVCRGEDPSATEFEMRSWQVGLMSFLAVTYLLWLPFVFGKYLLLLEKQHVEVA